MTPEELDARRLRTARCCRRVKFNTSLYPAWMCPRAWLYSHWLDRVVSVRCHVESMDVEEWATLAPPPREKRKHEESYVSEYPLHLENVDNLWT